MTDAPLATQAPPGGDGLLGTAATAAGVLAAHLATEAGSFLRELPSVDLHTLRRVGAALHTFEPLLDPGWSRELRDELDRLGALLGQERAYGRRLARLLGSLDSLTYADPEPAATAATSAATAGPVPQQRLAEGLLARHSGAPKARALMERQLTLGRSRAHTTALQELGSARFHALADRMTLLISDLPLRTAADADLPADGLLPFAVAEARALVDAVAELPLDRSGIAYTGDTLHDPGDDRLWNQTRALVLRAQYALEVCVPLLGSRLARPGAALGELARTLARHRDAAEAAEAAALAALTPRITPATAYVLGVVHADQRLEVEAARHTFSCTWPDLDRSGWLTDAWLTSR